MEGWLRIRAELYRAFMPHYTPAQIDGMEVWQVAALLGADKTPKPTEGRELWNGRLITEADRRRLERFASVSTDSDITGQVMRQMGIVTSR